MNVTTVTEGIYRLSANVKDILFEGLWDMPNGIAMNSYIVKGEKTAIVDGVCGWDGVPETLFAQFKEMNLDPDTIDYVIVNHMEPDHCGWIAAFKKIRPKFKVVTSKKALPLMKGFFDIDEEDVMIVGDGSTLDLGDGRVLAFAEIPNVHWPETIATFDTKSGTLMPCDAFGSFGAIDDKVAPYDDQLTADQIKFFEKEAVRYFATIVSSFSQPVLQAIDKAANKLQLPIKIIAPGHGIVWRKDPMKIVNDFVRLANYQKGPCENEVTLLWSTMYGNTELCVKPAIEALEAAGVKVHVHNVPESNWSDILTSAWTSTGLVIGMPTHEYKMFPPMYAILQLMCKKKYLNRKVFRFGSYGWSGGAQKALDDLMAEYKPGWDFVEPVEFLGKPTDQDFELVRKRCTELAENVKKAVASK